MGELPYQSARRETLPSRQAAGPTPDQQFLVVANYIAYPCCGDDSPVLSIELLTSVWQKTPDFQSVAGIARAFARFRMLDFG